MMSFMGMLPVGLQSPQGSALSKSFLFVGTGSLQGFIRGVISVGEYS